MQNMKKTILALAALVAVPTVAAADPQCPKTYKKKKVVKKKKVPAKIAAPAPCDCPAGPAGQRGLQGPPGAPGQIGRTGLDGKDASAPKFPLDIGVFGTYMSNGDWAWGPALQVGGLISDNYEMTLMGGLAMGADGGDRESGYTARLAVNRRLNDGATVGLGVGTLSIDGTPSNGNIGAEYLTLDIGASVSHMVGPVKMRLNLMPVVVGIFEDTNSDDTEMTFGSTVSLFGSVRW